MSTTILAALRTQTQLHGNTFLIATEIAHRMNAGRATSVWPYEYIAVKAHCCEPTLSSLSREKFDKDGRPHCQTTVGF